MTGTYATANARSPRTFATVEAQEFTGQAPALEAGQPAQVAAKIVRAADGLCWNRGVLRELSVPLIQEELIS
jgi:hypothetical protein